MKKLFAILLLSALSAVTSFSGCSSSAEEAAPLFSGVDRIEIKVSGTISSNGTINYTLPNGSCDFVVIAVFDLKPTSTNNVLNGTIQWGTRTNFEGFVLGAQPISNLCKYDSTRANGQGDFDPNLQLPPSTTGLKYVAIWAWDSGGNLVASSPATDIN